jgi:osmotically-inducible protein OsmY
MSRLITLLLGAAAGAAAAHFLDPDSGARRRGQLKDTAGPKAKASAAQAVGTASAAADKAKGAAISAAPSKLKPTKDDAPDTAADDDVTLARKVETEIFRPADVPKGDVSVDVQEGVVHLRGAVDDEWIARLADDAKKVDGVKGVKNLLHRPGTPAPTSD